MNSVSKLRLQIQDFSSMNRVGKYIFVGFLLLVADFALAQDLYRVKLLPFSSRVYNDFAPVVFEDGLIFCSDRKSNVLIDYKTPDNSRLLNMFMVERKDSLKWGSPKILSKELSSVFNEGPSAYNEETKTLFFTRNLSTDKKTKNKENNYGLFYSRYNGTKWVNIRAFEHNDPSYKVAHPSLSSDGQTLYFSSDMPGGYGKSDIYVSRLVRSRWTKPENLGPEINTAGSELYPFILSDEVLYFSSDRAGSKGGLDIFTSAYLTGKWTTPSPLEAPINSNADDFGFISNNTASSGYFSSNRNSVDDIYSFESNVPLMVGCQEQKENKYCYIFYDRQMSDLDSVPNLVFSWDLGDGTILDGVKVRHCYEKPGVYDIRLDVRDTLTTQETYLEQSYSLVEAKAKKQVYIKTVDTCYTGTQLELTSEGTYLPEVEIAEYFWDFDNGTRSKLKEPKCIFQVEGTYMVRLLIKSTEDKFGEVEEFCSYKNIVVLVPRQE